MCHTRTRYRVYFIFCWRTSLYSMACSSALPTALSVEVQEVCLQLACTKRSYQPCFRPSLTMLWLLRPRSSNAWIRSGAEFLTSINVDMFLNWILLRPCGLMTAIYGHRTQNAICSYRHHTSLSRRERFPVGEQHPRASCHD